MERSPDVPWRPTPEEVARAAGRTIPDVLEPGLALVFCGINPGLYSGAIGHHFARPGNRFWSTIHRAGFTDRLLSPFEDGLLPRYGIGVTNLVERSTAQASELSADELRAGGARLLAKLQRLRPGALAIVGISAYRTAFDRPRAAVGLQEPSPAGMPVWVVPNPSGLNAHYRPADLVDAYRELRGFLKREIRGTAGAGPETPTRRSSRSSSSGRTRRTHRTSRSPR